MALGTSLERSLSVTDETPVIELANHVKMPLVGYGTFRVKGDEAKTGVKTALRCGYRHIDTATCYMNEKEIGESIKEWREEQSSNESVAVFLTSKLQPRDMHHPEDLRKAFLLSCEKLRVTTLDLYLIHWPGISKRPPSSHCHREARHRAWTVLEDFYLKGCVRAIGVSNFTRAHLEDLLFEDVCGRRALRVRVIPHVNQVEFHPQYQQRDLRAFCQEHGIQVVAYSSFGVGDLLEHQVVQHIVASHPTYPISPAAVLLRWTLQQGIPVLPKSVRPNRIEENIRFSLDPSWELSPTDIVSLDSLDQADGKKTWNPNDIR